MRLVGVEPPQLGAMESPTAVHLKARQSEGRSLRMIRKILLAARPRKLGEIDKPSPTAPWRQLAERSIGVPEALPTSCPSVR